jgi:hypothetical protein
MLSLPKLPLSYVCEIDIGLFWEKPNVTKGRYVTEIHINLPFARKCSITDLGIRLLAGGKLSRRVDQHSLSHLHY